MSGKTSIEWTRGDDGSAGATWNPVRGCSRISPGCGGPNHQGGCYAEKIAARFSGPGQPFEGFAKRTAHGGAWTGKMALLDDMLTVPLRWRKPRRIFVNSMSDLFHENLPDEAIDRVFAVMALAPQHTFQVLTKRADRMRTYMATSAVKIDGAERRDDIASAAFTIREELGLRRGEMWFSDNDCMIQTDRWPLPNVWLGVSVEDQERAEERIPHLLATPAAVRFLSCEPLLGPLDLRRINIGNGVELDALTGYHSCSMMAAISDAPKGVLAHMPILPIPTGRLSLVIIGGESGPRSRPFLLSWASSLIDQCRPIGTAAFMKQLGAEAYDDRSYVGSSPRFETKDRKGGDMAEWPEDLRVREFPDA